MSCRNRVLIIGCGRIGVSHAKALGQNSEFDFTLYDSDREVCREVAQAYGASVLGEITSNSLRDFQVVVIATPTSTHFDYLDTLISSQVAIVVCEKPICNDLLQLDNIETLYETGCSRVLVNYTRRFQPAYQELRDRVSSLLRTQELRACSIRYQRGFLNNASHAVDLLQFLLGRDICGASVIVGHSAADKFCDDPTISCVGSWNEASLSIVGLPSVRFSLFEIDLFFEREAVRLRDRGQTIEMATSDVPGDYYAPLRTESVQPNCLGEPFNNLYQYAERMLACETIEDNFRESVKLTRWMIEVQENAK